MLLLYHYYYYLFYSFFFLIITNKKHLIYIYIYNKKQFKIINFKIKYKFQ